MKVFMGLIFIVILAVGGYFVMQQKPHNLSVNTNPTSTPSPIISRIPTSSETEALRQGGSSFKDPQNVWTILYPSEYKQDTENNGQYIRFYKTGKTQTGQTEMYDGVIINIETISLKGQTLSSFLDVRIKQSAGDGTSEVVEPKKSIILNTYPGFTYAMRGLGVHTYTVLQKDTNSPYAVSVTTLVEDPQKLGYQKEVDSTLSTLDILK